MTYCCADEHLASDLDADWQRLWALAERLTSPAGADPAYPSFRWAYGSTAQTRRVDGTQGIGPPRATAAPSLHRRQRCPLRDLARPHRRGTAPIVMTVPMASDSPNYIVGASLREFVALGCRTGYYRMEQLAHFGGRQEEIAWLERGQWPMGMAGWDGPGQGIDPVELLEALGQEFALAPWPKVEQRLGELQTRYLPAPHPPQS